MSLLLSAFPLALIFSAEGAAIDRKVLGGIVFADKAQMKRLTDIVWPRIMELALETIEVCAVFQMLSLQMEIPKLDLLVPCL